MKTIILNGSPRKNWNTAEMLKSVQKGAESVGAETEYIDLYSLKRLMELSKYILAVILCR